MPAMSIGGKAPGSSLANAAKKAAATGRISTGSDTGVRAAGTGTPAKNKNKSTATTTSSNLAPKWMQNLSTADYKALFTPGGALWEPEAAKAGPLDNFDLEKDPVYRAALDQGKSTFTFAQAQALADKQNQETALAADQKSLDVAGAENRRRIAGNYAARGMAGGAAGAKAMAEARANAQQIAAQTSIKDQITALNNQFLSNYGDVNKVDAQGNPAYDWTSTNAGMQYKTQAAQAAIQARLAQYGVA